MTSSPSFILTLSCDDKAGIVAKVTGFLHKRGGFITESSQYGDPDTNRFFMRVVFTVNAPHFHEELFCKDFQETIASVFSMDWALHNPQIKPKLLIMASKLGHCVSDLLHRTTNGMLDAKIAAIVSNHQNLKEMASWYGIDFHYLPITEQTKLTQEATLLKLIDDYQIDTVVLARYMQVLSAETSEKLRGCAINIHHSFLPSFKGAKPYHQAHARGVKLIGATGHYITGELDEGPIIEQEIIRVNHTHTPSQYVALGHDIERVVLARSVKYHIERRVLLNGHKTVVFT
jgi:formyltetrahydrofolate deformylase